MRHYETIVVLPVGPGTRTDFIIDTISSFVFYTTSSYRIILVDDSHQGIGRQVQEEFPDLDVILTKRNGGAMAGLYITLAEAYAYALRQYSFDLLFKLDTDALVTGPEPEEEARRFFATHPDMGMAGQYPLDYQGRAWDTAWPRDRIMNGTMTWKFIKRPIANMLLRKLYIRALRHGYRTGESVFGGAYFMSYPFLKALADVKMLPSYTLRSLNMGEDHLFGLLAKSLGFGLGDLASGDQPFACAWKGLPASPEELHQRGKKVIHSTRGWKDLDEESIRAFFREKRTRPVPSTHNALAAAD